MNPLRAAGCLSSEHADADRKSKKSREDLHTLQIVAAADF
jgi:hypothetical protein